jgi:hypothetical protein
VGNRFFAEIDDHPTYKEDFFQLLVQLLILNPFLDKSDI